MNKLNFRSTTSVDYSIEPEESNFSESPNTVVNSSTNEESLSEKALKIDENIRRERERNEPYQMFFYYPRYLHPEAVALIAQNLLNQWEDEETSSTNIENIDNQQENQK